MKKLLAPLIAVTMMLLMTACDGSGYDQTATTTTTTRSTTTTTSYEDYMWQQKYGDLPTARQAQYDKHGFFGRSFLIEGTAELDDYYNWGYENYEYGYFCINIRPIGGTYSDEWYVYANRNNFSELYNDLLSGSRRVTLVARIEMYDTGSNNMATLVDFK